MSTSAVPWIRPELEDLRGMADEIMLLDRLNTLLERGQKEDQFFRKIMGQDMEYLKVLAIRVDQVFYEYRNGCGSSDASNFQMFFRRLSKIFNDYDQNNWRAFNGAVTAFDWFPRFYVDVLTSYPDGDRKTPSRPDNAPLALPVVGDAQVPEEQPVSFIRVKETTELGTLEITAPNIDLLREAAEIVQDTHNNRTENCMLVQNNEINKQKNAMKILDKQIELARLQSPSRGLAFDDHMSNMSGVATVISPGFKRTITTTPVSSSNKKMKMTPQDECNSWDGMNH